jgi:hypothetical protein
MVINKKRRIKCINQDGFQVRPFKDAMTSNFTKKNWSVHDISVTVINKSFLDAYRIYCKNLEYW